jgi:hypothetical protein
LSVKLTRRIRLSGRWTDAYGRPYTFYDRQTRPPTTAEVNASRLPRFERIDLKIVADVSQGDFNGELFLDLVNFRNRRNTAMMYAMETIPGEYVSVPYGGTKFFPIAGITVRW